MNPPLESLVRKPKTEIDKPTLLLLLHGVGSNEKDLYSLADHLPDTLLVVSVRGPLVMGRDRFGWYEINFQGGTLKIDVVQQENSHKLLLEFLNYLEGQYTFDTQNVWIGGFSQGAVMSYSVGLENPDQFRGIIALSGRMLEETKNKIGTTVGTKKQKIYIAHGTNDNVISIAAARSSKEFLESTGRDPHYKEYAEGHTISREMLKDLVTWFAEQL
ncbi:alpha/beta hydrolase [Leptospira sp. WS39.C2]